MARKPASQAVREVGHYPLVGNLTSCCLAALMLVKHGTGSVLIDQKLGGMSFPIGQEARSMLINKGAGSILIAQEAGIPANSGSYKEGHFSLAGKPFGRLHS